MVGDDYVVQAWRKGGATPQELDEVMEIFFESSATKTFADGNARTVFAECWLIRYLRDYPEACFVLKERCGSGGAPGPQEPVEQGHPQQQTVRHRSVLGYLVGAFGPPAWAELAEDLVQYDLFCDEIANFPAHLHINMRAEHRGRGLGGRLIEAFAGACKMREVCGVHVLTAAAGRNISFYRKCGFRISASRRHGERDLVLLVRPL